MQPTRPATPHLLHVFPSFVPAGAQVRTCGLIRAFGGEFRHSVLALDGQTDAQDLLGDLPLVRILHAPPKSGSPRTAFRLSVLFDRERPDLVLTYNFGALDAVAAAKLTGLAPIIHHEDGFNPDEAERLKLRRVLFRRLLLPGAAAVVVISRNLERIAIERYRLPHDLVHFIPNGIDVARFKKSDGNRALRRRLEIPEDAVVVGAVGHLRSEKNYARLLEAMRLALTRADVRLLLLGDGAERERLEALAGAPPLAGRVVFAGYQKDPRDFYRAMDVCAISSDTEQMPLSLLEAMASSLPMVATGVGDVAAMLPEEQKRFVVPVDEGAAGALADAIATLAADPALRADLGSRNRRRVEEHYTLTGMLGRYRALYLGAIGHGQRRART